MACTKLYKAKWHEVRQKQSEMRWSENDICSGRQILELMVRNVHRHYSEAISDKFLIRVRSSALPGGL